MELDSEDRPWGSWHVVDVAEDYKLKRLHVKPGHRLSLQSHRFRSEHWVIVRGVATCEVDGRTSTARAGDTVDVAIGARHRLANLGSDDLLVVEVQLGTYTGEDDIERFDDDYGRLAAVS